MNLGLKKIGVIPKGVDQKENDTKTRIEPPSSLNMWNCGNPDLSFFKRTQRRNNIGTGIRSTSSPSNNDRGNPKEPEAIGLLE